MKNPFKKKKQIENLDPKTYLAWEHTGWGNSIYFTNWESRRVTGHLQRIPRVGDFLKNKMVSGKIGVFRFEKVEQMHNPYDQFFATVSDFKLEDSEK